MISRSIRLGALAATFALAFTACSSDSATTPPADTPTTAATVTTAAAATSETTKVAAASGVTATGISDDRCKANKAAGKITYLSGFDFAASAGIVEVVVAKEKGYFEKMCLDVDIKSSFSTANYAIVGADKAQFASAGSFTEMLANAKDGAKFVAVAHSGKVGVDALLVREGAGINTPADLKGKTIGVKGALPPSEVALLAKYGLRQGKDYSEVTSSSPTNRVSSMLPASSTRCSTRPPKASPAASA
jgi:ABC-type nitrate/sulfonate/bicarbonate transport system substrate-binding protein